MIWHHGSQTAPRSTKKEKEKWYEHFWISANLWFAVCQAHVWTEEFICSFFFFFLLSSIIPVNPSLASFPYIFFFFFFRRSLGDKLQRKNVCQQWFLTSKWKRLKTYVLERCGRKAAERETDRAFPKRKYLVCLPSNGNSNFRNCATG